MLLHLVDFGGAQIRAYSGRNLIRSLISAGYLAIGIIFIVYGYNHQQQYLRMAGIAVLSLGGLIAWLAALKRYRVIADTPTAVLRSAAQGYVELVGTCRAIPDADLLHYGKAPPCLWYLATIIEQNRSFGKTRTNTRYERSEDTFLIEDGTGECAIDPEHAEVLSAHQTSWRNGNTYYKVRYLLPGDHLYAIGDMRTLRAADGTLDHRADVNALLREWKTDRAALVQRFDTDGDGEIDLQEWQGAVSAAGREVDARHRDMRLEPGLHLMRAPGDGRPFLLS
ncbi:MAG: hypothetical protein KAR22_15935, partial [Gammaproteobacteria bacterium]|nr:hypothetical protein [Gammaproteobacteria bacterium]